MEDNEKREYEKLKKWHDELKEVYQETQAELEVYKRLYEDLIDKLLERVNDD